jgi:UDP-galactopyranose mutase
MFQVPPGSDSCDLICFSHLRWNFVFQRPQHLMTRCARERRVFYVEEPVFQSGIAPRLHIERSGAVTVIVPYLPEGMSAADANDAQRELLQQWIDAERISEYLALVLHTYGARVHRSALSGRGGVRLHG